MDQCRSFCNKNTWYRKQNTSKITLHLWHCKKMGVKNLYVLIDKEIKDKYGVKNMNELTKLQTRKYKIGRVRLFKGTEHSVFVHEDIAITIIMQSRLSDPETIKYRSDLWFNQINLILNQSVVMPLLKAFSAEKIELQRKILKN